MVTDREVLPGWARVRTKYAEKTSVSLWGQSRDPRELSGVTGAGTGVARVLQGRNELGGHLPGCNPPRLKGGFAHALLDATNK